jgi:hypothetical protein
MTPAGIEPATYRLVAQHLNQLPSRAPKMYIQCINVKRTASAQTRAVQHIKYGTLTLEGEMCISHVFGMSAAMFLEGCSQ